MLAPSRNHRLNDQASPRAVALPDRAAADAERDERGAAGDTGDGRSHACSIDERRGEQCGPEQDVEKPQRPRDFSRGERGHGQDQGADQVVGVRHAALGAERDAREQQGQADERRTEPGSTAG